MGKPRREYVFRNLLICHCERRLAAHCVKDHVYYRCRPDVVNPCGTEGIREDALLPWGDVLFEKLGAVKPDEFAETVASKTSPRVNGDSRERVDNAIDKLRKLLLWGHTDEGAYQVEHERLAALREEIAASPTPPTVRLEELAEAWRLGNAAERRKLLGDLFDGLRVEGKEIVTFIPRADNAAGVALMIEEATGGLVTTEREGFEPSVTESPPDTDFPGQGPRPD